MKIYTFILSLYFLFLFLGTGMAQNENSAELIKKVGGFSHPESVVYDRQNRLLYVSNIGEQAEEDGFISVVSEDGEVIEMRWITGLNDPKGLLLRDGRLYVTDVTQLVEMDIETGTINKKIAVEGAAYLNDITMDEEGNIYISDSRGSAIYKMDSSGNISEWLKTKKLEFVNGVLAVDDNIYVAAWGRENPGNLLKVNRESKEIEQISSGGIGNLDGIQEIEDNDFYISDWATGKIYRIDDSGNQTEILTSEKSAGDILFLKEENKLVLPMNRQNEVWWYELN